MILDPENGNLHWLPIFKYFCKRLLTLFKVRCQNHFVQFCAFAILPFDYCIQGEQNSSKRGLFLHIIFDLQSIAEEVVMISNHHKCFS